MAAKKFPKKYRGRTKSGTRYNGYKPFKHTRLFKDADPQILKPKRNERAILSQYYAEEFRPPTQEEILEEMLAEKEYMDKDKQFKVGKKWNACRIQMLKAATPWKKAEDVAHNIGEIEPKTEMPFANMRANMDFEGLGQMNKSWETKLDK